MIDTVVEIIQVLVIATVLVAIAVKVAGWFEQ